VPSGFIPDQVGIEELFNDPAGPIGLELEKIGAEGVTIAQRFAPVVTGALQASIRYTVEEDPLGGLATYIGSDLDYAIYIEYGTGHGSWVGGPTEADAFLRPMLQVVQP